jgi:DNA-binding NarL/FixJ family response regulator
MPPSGTDEGLRAAERIGESHPGVGVLVLSDYLEPEFATRLLESGTPGRGYLLKESVTDLDRFADSIRRVACGESVVDPAIIRRVLGTLRVDDPLVQLSEREHEILALMAEGRTNHAIAEHFVISERTVESHVGNVFSKLGLASTPDDHRRVLAVLAYLRAA